MDISHETSPFNRQSQQLIFAGIRFVLVGYDPFNRAEVSQKLVTAGAVDAGSKYGADCTHVIFNNIVYDDPVCVAARRDGKRLVSGLWVDHSLYAAEPLKDFVFYEPPRDLNGIPGAKSLVIGVTGYLPHEKEIVRVMADLMGAKFTKQLKADTVTHLVCYKFKGATYELAKIMKRIKLVNHKWLEDCLKKWEILPEEDYSKSGHDVLEMEAKAKDSKDEAEGTTTRQNERKLASPEVPRSLSNTGAHRRFSNAENVVSATTKSSSDQFSNPYEIKSRHPGTGTVFGDTTGPSNIFEGTASGSTTQNNIMAASTHGKRKMDISSGSSKLQRISLDDDISIRESSHVESGQELRKNPQADISYINNSNGLAAAFELEAQENMQVPDADADAVAVDDDHLEKKTDGGTDKVADMNRENDVNKKVTKISKPTLRKTRKDAALSVEQETDTIADNKKRKPSSSRSVQARILEAQKKMQISAAAADDDFENKNDKKDDDVTEMDADTDANKETKKKKRPLSKTKKDPALSVKEVTETKAVKKKGKTTSSRSVKVLDMEAQKENMEIPEDDRSTGNKQVLKSATEGSEKVTCKSDKADSEPKWFILTGNSLQRKEFQQLIRRLKGGVCNVSHQWSYQATHLIVPDPIERTAKLFAAAASGRWILKTDYLTASNQAGKFLAEEPYEWHENKLSDDEKIDLEAPRKWRLLKEKTGYGAFHGMRIVIYGECTAPSLDTLERAVKAGDGTILATSPPYTRFLDNGIDFAVVSPGVPSVNIWVQWFLRSEIPCISADYLVEYVCKPGYPLDGHVRYGTNDWAERSYNNLKKRLDEEDNTGPRTRDSYDVACEVCGLHDRGEDLLICGDKIGSIGCGAGTHIDCLGMPIDKHFMAVLLNELGDGSQAWLASEHIITWINFLKKYGNSAIRDGKVVKWTILTDAFDQTMTGDDKHVDKGPVVVDACDDLVLTKTARKFDESLFGGDRPLSDVNYVYTPINAHRHWYLAKINMQTFHVTIYDSLLGHEEKLMKERVRDNWSKQLYKLLNEIKFWENSGRNNPGTLNLTVEFDKTVPEQEGVAGDCGVMVCRNLEMLVRGLPLGGGDMSGKQIATEYRERMAKEIYKKRYKKGMDGGQDPAQVPQDNAQDPQDNAQDHQDKVPQDNAQDHQDNAEPRESFSLPLQ